MQDKTSRTRQCRAERDLAGKSGGGQQGTKVTEYSWAGQNRTGQDSAGQNRAAQRKTWQGRAELRGKADYIWPKYSWERTGQDRA